MSDKYKCITEDFVEIMDELYTYIKKSKEIAEYNIENYQKKVDTAQHDLNINQQKLNNIDIDLSSFNFE
jgi:hypothetical protein